MNILHASHVPQPRTLSRPRVPNGRCQTSSRGTSTRLAAVQLSDPPTPLAPPPPKPITRLDSADIVVIGSGVGGLTCAALLSYYGLKVTVCESHSVPGGTAHGWHRGGFHFDNGPTLFSGLEYNQPDSSRSDNPLAAVLALVGEDLELIPCRDDQTCLVFPEGHFRTQIGSEAFSQVATKLWGRQAAAEWEALQAACMAAAGKLTGVHAMAIRHDPWVAATTALYSPFKFLSFLLASQDIQKMSFAQLLRQVVRDPQLLSFVELLCRGTTGLPPEQVPAAYMARAFQTLYHPSARLELPRGGSQALADALTRAIRKRGGTVLCNAHVDRISSSGGKATGVVLRGGREIRASLAVVSNASAWDTLPLVDPADVAPQFAADVAALQMNDSFMHLHLGFDATGLPPQPLHYYYFKPHLAGDSGWPTVAVPSAVDPGLAPPGHHCLHAYLPESFTPWEGVLRGSAEHNRLKEERVQAVWQLVERVIPDIRQRVVKAHTGSPLTHQHFLRRRRGNYGPRLALGTPLSGGAPQAVRPLSNMICCGDSTYPGVGTPAAAASGMWAANTLVSVWDHWGALVELEL